MPSPRKRIPTAKERNFKKKHGLSYVGKPIKIPKVSKKDRIVRMHKHLAKLDRTENKMSAQTQARIREVRQVRGLKGFFWGLTGERNRKIIDLLERDIRIKEKSRALSAPIRSHILTDAMSRSGLLRRDAFIEEMRNNLVHGKEHALMIFDLDKFSDFNESYGHLAGDWLLQAMADAIGEVSRNHGGKSSRYGGEEFTIYFPKLGLNPIRIAKEVDEVFREKAKQDPALRDRMKGEPPTFSAGYSEKRIGKREREDFAKAHGKKQWNQMAGDGFKEFSRDNFVSIIEEADIESLYKAKEGGRNRIICAGKNLSAEIR